MNYKKELRLAKIAAKKTGDYLMFIFKKPQNNHASFKPHREILTCADITADEMIKEMIKTEFPSDKILSEELSPKQKKAPRLWLIDPLDGTNNFVHGIPIFAVCAAFAEDDDLKAGVVYLPYQKELFWAVKGGGAFVSSPFLKRGARGDFKKISVSKTAKLKNSVVLTCHSYALKYKKMDNKLLNPLKLAAASTRRLGAAGYELSAVAQGLVDGGYIIGTRPWDSAAGALIVREAGGRVTDFSGKEWGIWDNNILFSNKLIHNELLKIIK